MEATHSYSVWVKSSYSSIFWDLRNPADCGN